MKGLLSKLFSGAVVIGSFLGFSMGDADAYHIKFMNTSLISSADVSVTDLAGLSDAILPPSPGEAVETYFEPGRLMRDKREVGFMDKLDEEPLIFESFNNSSGQQFFGFNTSVAEASNPPTKNVHVNLFDEGGNFIATYPFLAPITGLELDPYEGLEGSFTNTPYGQSQTPQIPLPGAALLLGSGLAALGGYRRRNRRRKEGWVEKEVARDRREKILM